MNRPSTRSVLVASTASVVAAALTVGALTSSTAPAVGAEAAPPTPPGTSATFAPSLAPNRLGARAALTLALRYTGGKAGVPSPIRKLVVRFPAGLSIDIPKLRSCPAARLRAHGPSACPVHSRIGRGHARAETRAGSQLLTENVALWAFIGPPRGSQPTVEVFGQGHTPFDQSVLLTATVRPGPAPYGEELAMSIPRIPTLRLEPDASMASLSLTLGASRQTRDANAVLVPPHCPTGGFPFAAESTYADGSTSETLATVPCPRDAHPSARTARTISVNETGHLHLVAKHGFTLEERGSASGTFSGTIYVRLTAVSTSRVTAEVSIRGRRGSISGHATASYRTGRTAASFSGSMSIAHGTGSYVHAHGPLSFSGTIQRSNSAIAVRVSGRASA